MHLKFTAMAQTCKRGKIKPHWSQPVMELNAKRAKLGSDYNPDSGVRCLLYEAKKNLSTQTSDEVMLIDIDRLLDRLCLLRKHCS